MDKFGSRVNSKGYRVLPDYIRVLQADGINVVSLEEIPKNLKARGSLLKMLCLGWEGEFRTAGMVFWR
ncbi:hypothetical protein CRD36_10505 [Paremcibacter congregatus]|uniref:Uncharacterized protein n=1 Tax=Paremcibacter congregatus TaxID=2043170 RepID=A0A2G4YQW4_9PROT|nr:hypothetical protein CRD36_10505 [Paremcibacter congregatus]QDE28904.1 hypothetical protein FIV45_17270 [Paremcibacter congregatus]